MSKTEEAIRAKLFEHQDLKYRDFTCKLTPSIKQENVIGVRNPEVRKLAKELLKEPDYPQFLDALPHRYYEENNLHGCIIEGMKNYDEIITRLDAFLPYVDNWATCDIISPKVFKKHLPELYEKIPEWIASDHTYTKRFGIEMLMNFYLGDAFTLESAEMVAAVRSEEYYVNMMTAWYFATALAKQYDAVLPFIENKKLDKWTHNKTIQKSVESFRITDEQKAYLKSLKIK